MSNIHGAAHAPSESLEAELQAIQVESIGWTPDAQMAEMNVLLLA